MKYKLVLIGYLTGFYLIYKNKKNTEKIKKDQSINKKEIEDIILYLNEMNKNINKFKKQIIPYIKTTQELILQQNKLVDIIQQQRQEKLNEHN